MLIDRIPALYGETLDVAEEPDGLRLTPSSGHDVVLDERGAAKLERALETHFERLRHRRRENHARQA